MVQIVTKEGPRRITRSEEREWRMSTTQNEGMLRKPEWKGALSKRWRIMNKTEFGYVSWGLHGPHSPPGKSGDTSASPTVTSWYGKHRQLFLLSSLSF